MKHHIIPIISMTLLFTGCASIVSKNQYPVSIKSNPPGANFVIKKKNGEVISAGTTPSIVVLRSSRGYFLPARYLIEFSKNGVTKSIPITASLDGWYVGNLALGLFGAPIGFLIVDPVTGAMWRLDESVTATFDQTAQNKRELKVCPIDEIPEAWKKSLIELK